MTGSRQIPPKQRRNSTRALRTSKNHQRARIVTAEATSVVSPALAPKSNLRPPWQKGESGNPAGYPKKYAQIVKLARAYTGRAIDRLVELMESNDERVALLAAQALLERGWGKPREFADEPESAHAVQPAVQPDFSLLSIQERGQFMKLAAKLYSADPAFREEAKRANRELLGLPQTRPS